MLKKKRLGTLDWFVLLLLVLCLAGAILRSGDRWGDSFSETAELYHITLCAEHLHPMLAEGVQVGDIVYGEGGEVLGNIRKRQVRESSFYLGEQGSYHRAIREDAIDLLIEMECNAAEVEGGLLWNNNQRLLRGQRFSLRTDRAHLSATVLDFSALEAS